MKIKMSDQGDTSYPLTRHAKDRFNNLELPVSAMQKTKTWNESYLDGILSPTKEITLTGRAKV